MQYSSVELIWAIVVVIFVLLVLASTVLSTIILHSKKIRKSEEKFRTLYERVFDALILINKDGEIIDVNESAGRLLGFVKEDLDRKIMTNFIAPVRRSDFEEGFSEAFKGGSSYLGEFEMIGNNDIVIHAEVGCTGLEIHGYDYVLASFRDITGRILAEAKLRDKNIALREVLANLEQDKVKIKKQVASAVEHVLMPSLDKLINQDGTVNTAYYRSLKENLREMASFSVDMGDAMTKLSPREMEICKLTRNGSTAKEIAIALNITVATVEKHKEKIRKKLKISNKKINLATHLQAISRAS
ncbi:MAG: PAS domain S-box protein [candidate division Zixibacteria bacterium]